MTPNTYNEGNKMDSSIPRLRQHSTQDIFLYHKSTHISDRKTAWFSPRK